MLEMARGFCLAVLVAMAPSVVAQSARPTGDRALAHELAAVLGDRWTVRTTPDAVEAQRQAPRPRARDFDVRVDREIRRAERREPALTVDVARGAVHLAGDASDCDHVTEAAGHFAAIPGVDSVVVDTRCSPRQP